VSIEPEEARRRIEEEKNRIERLIQDVRVPLADEPASEDAGETDDPASHGTDTFEREKDLSILESLEHELDELEAALERIDAGTYGVDEVTGEPISPERLEARPAARTNVDTDRT
jgi:DnaK suppressor protein